MQVNDAKAAGKAAAAASPSTVDYQSFLKLLVAQAKSQDPLSPMDPTQYLSQLASFSSVEQSIQLNAKLQSLIGVSDASRGLSLIGREVESADGKIAGVVESVSVNASGTSVRLEDGRSFDLGAGFVVRRAE